MLHVNLLLRVATRHVLRRFKRLSHFGCVFFCVHIWFLQIPNANPMPSQ